MTYWGLERNTSARQLPHDHKRMLQSYNIGRTKERYYKQFVAPIFQALAYRVKYQNPDSYFPLPPIKIANKELPPLLL